MKNVKMILGGILGFISFVLLIILTIFIISKFNILNKNYVLEKLEEHDYYEKVYKEIKQEQEHNILSSGLDKVILNDLFTEEDVKDDLKCLIGSIYSDSKYEVNLSKIKEKLDKNIDDYLKEKDIKADDEKALEEFKNNIIDIYKDETSIYGYLNGFKGKYGKIDKVISICIIAILILISINLLIIKFLHKNYLGIILLSAGGALLYLKLFIWEGIDVKNIIIISESFSNVLKSILTDFGGSMMMYALIFIILGIIISILSSFKKIKRIKRS